MHLHSMTIQALGPFPGRHTIDFGQLGASGIFLLEGPTGAGKSSIIDALVFALYGKVASKEASEDRLRSAHAEPAVETFVDLVLETGSGIYRIRRTPRFERPKARGTGTTVQQPSAKLWRLTGTDALDDGELTANRLDEVGLEVQRLIGLDRTQFVQTVVLPQGEFAGFLRADPENRRGLLQKVFGTAVYEQVQRRLEQLRADAHRQVAEARTTVGHAVSQFLGAATVRDETVTALRAAAGLESDRPTDDCADVVPLVRDHATALVGAAERAVARAEAARLARAEAVAAYDRTRALVDLVQRRTMLRARLADLEVAAPAHDEAVARLTRATRARGVLPVLEGSRQAQVAAEAARRGVDEARAAAGPELWTLVDAETEHGVQHKTLLVERDRCTALRSTLDRLVVLERGLEQRRAAADGHAAARERRVTQRERAAAEAAARPEQRLTLTATIAEVRDQAAGLEAARHRTDQARLRLAAAEDVVTLAADVASAAAEVTAAGRAAEQAVDRAGHLHRARILGIAGELAATLVPGEACAVCGGTEHPAPAAAGADQVTPQDVEAAEAARSAAQEVLRAASDRHTVLIERLGSRRTAAEGRDVLTASIELGAAEGAVAGAAGAVTRLAALERDLASFDEATRRLAVRISDLTAEIAADDATLTGLRDQLLRDEVEVEQARDGFPTVEQRVGSIDVRSARVAAWALALGRLGEALDRAAERRADLDAALAAHGFDDGDEVTGAALGEPSLAELERRVAEHRAELAAVRAGLAEQGIAALASDVVVDLAAAERARQDADEEAARCAAQALRLTHEATAVGSAATAVEAAVTRLERASASAAPVIRMADLASANGQDNALRLTLATYVLARRFEDVMAAANARLLTMSDGRFELAASTEREDVGARKTGLAMKVLDHTTETARDPRTLSGGETFYVSLCLALGLADVVTAEAGGIDLGTLFIDEGFGSLDPQTLEVVLAELGRLRDAGRVVGVVSHVEALKQSIAERIEVRRRPDGSSTLSVRA